MTIELEPMEEFVPYLIPTTCLAVGIVLLCAGGRLLKSTIGLCAGLLGAGGGLLISPSIASSISPLITALIFGIVAAILAVYLAKLAILLILAVSFAIATPVLAWHIFDFGDGSKMIDGVVEAALTPDIQHQPSEQSTSDSNSSAEQVLLATLRMLTNDVNTFVQSGMRRANAAWDVIPNVARLVLVGTAITGLLIGLLIATFLPYLASVLVTSAAGSFLLVQGIRTFASQIWSPNELSSVTPELLLGAIVVLSIAGIGLQLTFRKNNKTNKRVAQ